VGSTPVLVGCSRNGKAQFVIGRPVGGVKWLGPIGNPRWIIHAAEHQAHTGLGQKAVVDVVEVKIGQDLAGEVADRQTPWVLQRAEPGAAGSAVEHGSTAGAIGEAALEQPQGAGAGHLPLQLASSSWWSMEGK
jgi:hypothetical protein